MSDSPQSDGDFKDMPLIKPIDLAVRGRFLGSKSTYKTNNPGHEILANAGLYTKTQGHIWSGDIDLIVDSIRLQEIAIDLGVDVYVLREGSYKPDRPISEIPWNDAVIAFPPRHRQDGNRNKTA